MSPAVGSRTEAPPTSDHATRTMRANRGRDTKPELVIRRLLHAAGERFRVDHRLELPGGRVRPDIVFTRAKVAIFVDGCFWHGCPDHMSWPAGNAQFWRDKIDANRDRDARQTALLEDAGWRVIRVWEHDEATHAVAQITFVLRSARNR